MKKRILPLLAFLLPIAACAPNPPKPKTEVLHTSSQAHAETITPQPTAHQPFDYYLLNLSWSPEFCATHATAPECAAHPAFVLHGLWPQNNTPANSQNQSHKSSRRNSGLYLENCSNSPGPANPSQYSDIYPDQGLLQHEWRTHGTCSGLTPDAFFTAARTAFHSVAIPPKLTQLTIQISLPPDEILGLFTAANPKIPATSLALSCGNNYLTAIEVCLDKSLHPIPCGAIRSCRANTVRIPPPAA
jgi:ribonuclease T2